MDIEIAIALFIEIGRWAKRELNETWSLGYGQIQVDISDQENAENQLPMLVHNAFVSRLEVANHQTCELLGQRCTALRTVTRARDAEQEYFQAGEILQSVYEARANKHKLFINLMFDELEQELTNIGINVNREKTSV